jgi:hypothetical protein
MPTFSVVITETVIARYAPLLIKAATKAAAINAADVLRCDGGLDDPESEIVKDVGYQVELHQVTAAPELTTEAEVYVTAAGHEAIDGTHQDEASQCS